MSVIGWAKAIGLASVTWTLSPIIGFFLTKFISYLYDASKEILDPSSPSRKGLPLTLRGVQDWRMIIELKEREAKRTELGNQIATTLGKLKDALYIAEDFFDLIEYHKLEKKAGELDDSSWVRWWWMRFYDSIRESSALKILRMLWLITRDELIPQILGLLRFIAHVIVIQPLSSIKEMMCWLCPEIAPLTSRWLEAGRETSALMLQRLQQSCLRLYVIIQESPALMLKMAKQVLRWMFTSGEHLPVTCFSSASSWMERLSCWFMSIEIKNRWASIVNFFKNCCTSKVTFKDIKTKYQNAELTRNRYCEEYFLKSYRQTDNEELNIPFMVPLYKVLDATIKNIEGLVGSADKQGLAGKVITESIKQAYNPRSSSSAEGGRQNWSPEDTTTTPFLTEEVIGRDGDCRMISKMLHSIEGDTCFSVIGIVGLPGSGKTTLAQYVYKHEVAEKHFELVLWVHVAQRKKVDIIYKEVYANKSEEYIGDLNFAALEVKLWENLRAKRCLVVLDDIWYINELQRPFLSALTGGSKILVTSRHEDILSKLSTHVKHTTIQISDLDDESFFNLFRYHAVGSKTVPPADEEKVKKIGHEIARRLKKSPLLASAVGATLRAKPGPVVMVKDWTSVQNENLVDENMGILWWCYQHLDEQIKQCFIFCSIFPRRYRLYQDELVNLWVAHGFINTTKDGQKMEKVGRGYFNKLVSTSFLKAGGKDPSGTDYYLIHDLMRDIASNIGGNDCFNIVDGLTEKVPLNVRHLCIDSCDAAMLKKDIFKLEKLYTLIIYEGAEDITEEVLEEMFNKLDKLRVLIFHTEKNIRDHDCESFSFPESIGRLRHLRYLGLQILRVPTVRLPGTLAKLYFLEVLDLGYNGHFDLSAVDMKNVINLRHLISDEPLDCRNIGTLTSLQTIPEFLLYRKNSKLQDLRDLKDLNKLQGKLEISGLGAAGTREEALEAKLADKEGLTELALCWFDRKSTTSAPEVQADVFDCLFPPINVEYLTISHYEGSRYPSWMLMDGTQESRISLKKLEFYSCSEPDPELLLVPVSSLVLRFCYWNTLPLPYSMKRLTELVLHNCQLPANIEDLKFLEKLIISTDHPYRIGILPTLPKSLLCIELVGTSDKFTVDMNLPKMKHIAHINAHRWYPPAPPGATGSGAGASSSEGQCGWEKQKRKRDRKYRGPK